MRSVAVLLAVVVSGIGADRVHGQVQKFPYRAVVVKDDVLVRSGGGEDYYPTMRLKRDAEVMVHRQDPGGWLAIAPPEGSFSWVQARYVTRGDGDSGTVIEDDIIVFVGSEFGEESSVWQRKLMSGMKVRILGEEDLDTPSGQRRMFRIAPPVRERRWIAGDAVIPADDTVRKEHDQNPFELPSGARRRPTDERPSAVTAPMPSARLQRIRQIRAEQRKLAELDQRFRSMLQQNPTTWDLQGLENDYNQLRAQVTWRPVAGQIDLRFPAIDRYRQRQAEYEDFQRLISETERRDAELLAAQMGDGDTDVSVSDFASPPAKVNVAEANPNGSLLDGPAFPFGGQQAQSPSQPMTATTGSVIRPNSRYVGAGIVQQLPKGGYVLTGPSGRHLARIKGSEAVDLDEFVGKQVGLYGERSFRDDLGSDFIEVSGLEPVRIRR